MISQVYDGGGTTNALQEAANLDAVIALGTQPTAIATGNHTGIELFMSVAADDKSPVVVCINHSTATISLSNIVHIQEDVVSAADMAFAVDRSVWGLAATTDHEPKRLVYFPCAPNSYVSIVCQSLDGSAVYARYRLTQMHTAAAGGVGAAEGDAATAGKQDEQTTLLTTMDADTGAIKTAVERSTADVTSTLYDGGGADNALQLEANSAAVVAGGAAVIDADVSNAIDIQVVNAAATESLTLLVTEYSNGTPTVANQIRQTEVLFPTADLAAEVNLGMVGLATATGYAKSPARVTVTAGAYIMISLAAESAAGAKYCRYQLHGSV